MISSQQLLNIAVSLFANERYETIVHQLLDIAYNVRMLEHKEIIDPKPSPMMKEYENAMNAMAGEDDNEKWAREFLTAPTDTPMDKAEELRKRFEKQQRLHPIEEALLKAIDLAGTGSVTVKELAELGSLTIDETRRGLEWLKYKNLIPLGLKIDEGRTKKQ